MRRQAKMILLVMKLMTAFILIGCLHVSARGVSQDISLSVRNAPLVEVFREIGRQSGYDFVYTDVVLRKSTRVSIEVKNVMLEEALRICLKNQELTYSIFDKTIVIKPIVEIKSETLPPTLSLPPPPVDIRGRVAGADGGPVVGATISVKGTKKSTDTDQNGEFVLHNIDEHAILVITHVQFETKSVALEGAVYVNITVQQKVSLLDETQVIAYGTTTRRFNVGAVSTVKAEDIENQPVSNVVLALQGRVPGLTISPASGAPGTRVKMQIRGQNTLRSTQNAFVPFDQPLIIIDGVPFAAQNQNINLVSSGGGGPFLGVGSPYLGMGALSNINPNDIESINVLRDADATSIYGSQGANGVILITTKKGKPGRTTLGVRINTGPNKVTRRPEFLNTKQYLQLRREGIVNDGGVVPDEYDGNYPDLNLFDSTRSVDWFKEFFGGTSNSTDANATLSGGTDNMSFLLSAGYNRTSYNFPGDYAQERMSIHSGFQYKSRNNKLTMDFTTDLSYSKNNITSNPDATSVNKLPPNTPELLDDRGNLVWDYNGYSLDYSFGPTGLLFFQQYAYLKQPYSMDNFNQNNSLQVTYRIVQGLSATVNLGYSRFTASETSQFPITAIGPHNPYRKASATFARNEFETVNVEPQVNYQQNIGRGVFSALAGATYKSNLNRNERITGVDYPNDGLLGSLNGAGRIVEAMSNRIPYKYIGVYGRVGYIYANRYILNITGRRDGSSNFGPGRRFGTFGSAGAGWIVSDENFFSGWKTPFSLVKFSANYGTNGSDGVDAYKFQPFWISPQFTTLFQNVRPYVPLNLYNPDYSWALKKSLNVMVDLGLFQDRLLLNATWYRNTTSDQLIGALLPTQTGFGDVVDNFAAVVQNKGWEFALTSTNIKTSDFTWTTNLNFFINRNKLAAFDDLDKSPYASYYTVGQSLNMVWGWRYKGVNETTGLFEFYDSKGDATYAPAYGRVEDGGDQEIIEDLQPGFSGGFGNTFSYKGLTLSLFFQFAEQRALTYLSGMYGQSNMPGLLGNVPVIALDRWRQPGDIAQVQRATAAAGNYDAFSAGGYFVQSTGAYSDASYIRLKTASLSYTFPANVIRKAGMESLTAYANAQNLLTITRYEIGDPELPGVVGGIPMQRTIAFGLLFNF